jgi:hypothetical protein
MTLTAAQTVRLAPMARDRGCPRADRGREAAEGGQAVGSAPTAARSPAYWCATPAVF